MHSLQSTFQFGLGLLLLLIGIIGVSLHYENPEDQQFAFDAAFLAVGAAAALWGAFGSDELYQFLMIGALIVLFAILGGVMPGSPPVDEAIAGFVVLTLLLVFLIPQNISIWDVVGRRSSSVSDFFARHQGDLDLGFGRRSGGRRRR